MTGQDLNFVEDLIDPSQSEHVVSVRGFCRGKEAILSSNPGQDVVRLYVANYWKCR